MNINHKTLTCIKPGFYHLGQFSPAVLGGVIASEAPAGVDHLLRASHRVDVVVGDDEAAEAARAGEGGEQLPGVITRVVSVQLVCTLVVRLSRATCGSMQCTDDEDIKVR